MKKLKRTYTRCAGLTALVLLALLLDALLLPHAPSIDVTIAAEIKATTSFFFIFVFLQIYLISGGR